MAEMIRKELGITVLEKRNDGGRIRINTGSVDRDKDRVFPQGAVVENYVKNPVTQWGHNYRDPWATIGRTNVETMSISEEGFDVDFDLRPAANEHDPQNVVRLLWNGDWVKTASIGFIPLESEENEFGGRDYIKWELLEWSLVPIPANQEALRLAVKGLEASRKPAEREKGEVPEENGQDDAENGSGGDPGLAWIRRLTVMSNLEREQTLFACFHAYSIDIPEDATKLDINEDGEIVEVPHPDAGKTVHIKHVDFVPPLEFYNEKWGDEDSIYSSGGPTQPDEKLVEPWDDEYEVLEMSEVLVSLPFAEAKAWGGYLLNGRQRPCKLTHRILDVGQRMIRRRLGMAKSVIPYSTHGDSRTAEEGTSWDAGAARARLREWAGGDDWSPDKYRKGFVFVDGEANLLTSYKGPHHDIVGGAFSVVWRGVSAAMGSLVFGARGGRIADEGDRRGVYNHLGQHYKQFDKPVPEFREYDEAELRAMFPVCFEQRAGGGLETRPTSTPDEQDGDGTEPEELDALAREIGELRRVLGMDALRREVRRLKEAFDDE